jgi:hypothetical protein
MPVRSALRPASTAKPQPNPSTPARRRPAPSPASGRSFTSFRAAPFSYPGGWGYRRWTVGQVLPGLFLSQGYYIGNWGAYGLAPPPPGLQWVRYGPDALLVNVYTGQVVDTIYGVFWW